MSGHHWMSFVFLVLVFVVAGRYQSICYMCMQYQHFSRESFDKQIVVFIDLMDPCFAYDALIIFFPEQQKDLVYFRAIDRRSQLFNLLMGSGKYFRSFLSSGKIYCVK